jgi:hypothetical protein
MAEKDPEKGSKKPEKPMGQWTDNKLKQRTIEPLLPKRTPFQKLLRFELADDVLFCLTCLLLAIPAFFANPGFPYWMDTGKNPKTWPMIDPTSPLTDFEQTLNTVGQA